jgi:hypothetical protein
LIQRTRHLDSIVARALLVAEFFNSIGQLLPSRRPIELVSFVPKAATGNGYCRRIED